MSAPFTTRQFGRFALWVLALAIALFALLWRATQRLDPFAFYDREYCAYAAKMTLARSDVSDRIIIMGDSRAEGGLIPAALDRSAVNLALAGGSPIEAYYTTERILHSPTPPRAVILSFTPFHFIQTNLFWQRTVRFGYLTNAELDEVCTQARRLNDRTLVGTSAPGQLTMAAKHFAYASHFPTLYTGALWNSHFGMRGPENREIYARILAVRGHHDFGPSAGNRDVDSEAFLPDFPCNPVADYYFQGAVQQLVARHVPVYFISAPHNEVSQRQEGLVREFNAYLTEVSKPYPGFETLGPLMPTLPPECFFDYAHLNSQGARLWSEEVRKRLNERMGKDHPLMPETAKPN